MKREYFLLISLMTILSLTAQNNSVIEKNQFKVNVSNEDLKDFFIC